MARVEMIRSLLLLIVCVVLPGIAPGTPRRIVSTTLVTDEIVASLVDASRIVAMSQFASDPATSNVAEVAGKINRFVDRNSEQIVALNPDLVLSTRYSKIELKDLLRQTGISYQELTQFETVADIEGNIRIVARAVGEEKRGEDFIAVMRQKFDVAGRQLSAERRAWRVLYLAPGEWTAGAKTPIHEVLQHAGLKNAASEAGISGNNIISFEKIIRIDPDIIVIGTGYARDADYFRQLSVDPRFASLRAIRMHRIVAIPSRYILTTSQFVADAALELSRRIQALPVEVAHGQ
jgi:iron complex transport system substrate-binding protein